MFNPSKKSLHVGEEVPWLRQGDLTGDEIEIHGNFAIVEFRDKSAAGCFIKSARANRTFVKERGWISLI